MHLVGIIYQNKKVFTIVSFYGILLSVIKLRRIGVAGHVASTGWRMLTKEKTTWVDLDVNKKKLNWMLM